MTTRIFVSHSSKDNALTKEVCALLAAAEGGEPGYEILVDVSTLEDGSPWPVQLHEMMADCHSAVVLLSDNAVASDWVLKELTILTWRKSLESGFPLFIAQFPSVTAARLEQRGFEPLQHRLIQGINSTDPAVIAQRVRARLQQDQIRPAQTLFEKLASRLGDLLLQIHPQSLSALAQKLGASHPSWRPGGDAQSVLVESVCCQIMRGELGQFSGMADLFDELKTKLPADNLKNILRLAAPHWVEMQHASRLGSLVEDANGTLRCGAVGINGNHAKLYTGKMYVHRAFPLEFKHQVHGPNPPLAGNTLDHYTKSICKFCRSKVPPIFEDMEDDDAIVKHLATGMRPWLFVVISPLDHKALAELQTRFPRVRLIIDMGPTHDCTTLPEGVVCLRPPVDTNIEETRWLEYQDALLSCAG